MTKFKIIKKIDLSFLGEGWKDCYLEFSAITFGEARRYVNFNFKGNTNKALDEVLILLEGNFIGGKAVDETGKVVEVKKEELKNFPVEIIVKVVNVLIGDIGKNV